jgi:hypothetical protein
VAWHYFGSWQTVSLVILIGIGIATPFLMRTTRAVVALSVLLLWLLISMSPWLMPFLATWLPARAALDFRRFVGGVDLAAILQVGAAGEWLWTSAKSSHGSIASRPPHFQHRRARLGLGLKAAPGEQLAFNGREEAFAHRVVEAVAETNSGQNCLEAYLMP